MKSGHIGFDSDGVLLVGSRVVEVRYDIEHIFFSTRSGGYVLVKSGDPRRKLIVEGIGKGGVHHESSVAKGGGRSVVGDIVANAVSPVMEN